jgi:hypothetical protein
MTEDEWRACTDPFRMLRLLHASRVSARKYQLFGAACCGRAWPVLADARCRDAAIALERFADGPRKRADKVALATAWGAAWPARGTAEETAIQDLAARCVYAAVQPPVAWWTAHWSAEAWLDCVTAATGPTREKEAAVVAQLLRDITGSPPLISSSPSAAVLAWNDGTVRRIAEGVYEERPFDRLPILHDALLDAGCRDEQILEHCRSDGPHARGCWAVDVLTGRS